MGVLPRATALPGNGPHGGGALCCQRQRPDRQSAATLSFLPCVGSVVLAVSSSIQQENIFLQLKEIDEEKTKLRFITFVTTSCPFFLLFLFPLLSPSSFFSSSFFCFLSSSSVCDTNTQQPVHLGLPVNAALVAHSLKDFLAQE